MRAASEDFTEAELSATLLQQVRTLCGESTMAPMAAASSMVDRSKRNGWTRCPGRVSHQAPEAAGNRIATNAADAVYIAHPIGLRK